MRRLISIIVCTTALALVLAGCDVNIEPTDLSAVTIENDRAVIEKTLGKPNKMVDAESFIVAAYTYDDKGYYKDCVPQPYEQARGQAALGQFVSVLFCSVEIGGAKSRQQAKMAAVYDADEKLLFAGSLDEADPILEKLTSIATRYAKAQSGDTDALIDLSKFAMIPGQKKMFLETAANTGSAEAAFELGQAYQLGAGVEQNDAKAMKWWLQAAEKDFVSAYNQLGKTYQVGIGVERTAHEHRPVGDLEHHGIPVQMPLRSG